MKWVAGFLALVVIAVAAPEAMAAGTSPGQLYAWGSNFYGELGSTTGLGADSPTPAPVTLPGATGPVRLAASGEFFSLAVTSTGQLFSFGLNASGQLGVPTNDGTANPTATPQQVLLGGASGPIRTVAAGANYTLVLTTTGQLYVFGDNDFGENGTATISSDNATPTLVTLPGATGAIVQAAAGSNSSLALTATGQVFGWGDNFDGALGNTINDTIDTANPPTQLVFPGQSGSITQIAEGYDFGLATTSSGQLYTWGDNSQGQLGRTPGSGAFPIQQILLPGATGAPARVYAGDSYSAVVTTTGQLYTFGDNDLGEMGNPINNNTGNPNPFPAPVTLPGAIGGVVSGAAGTNRTLAVTSSGQLFAFGENNYGQLGVTENNNPNPTPGLVPLPAGTTVDAVNTGPWAFHSLAIIADLSVATASLPAGRVASPYSATASPSGGIPGYSWTATGLPPGLGFDGTNGAISGTPTTAGTYTPVFTVTDADGIVASRSLTITIAPPPPPVAQITGQSIVGPTDTFTISCTGVVASLVCNGNLVATTRVKEQGSKVLSVSARKHKKPKPPKPRTVTVTVAQASYSIPAGRSATVGLTLNSFGKKLLAQFLHVPSQVSFTGSLSQTLTVTFAYPRVSSPFAVSWSWSCTNGNCHTTLGKLTITNLPAHPRVIAICQGGGCPFGRRVFNPHGNTLRLAPTFARVRFRPGARLGIEVLAANMLGKVVFYRIQTASAPLSSTQCFEPGARKPQRCT